ncbi:TFIIB-type zinc ribbon-containing protein [Uliginosibacterium aquaticum]|uniref:Zf-TFIIB domain-containing protein n=1 Tax=Uliginosibacterium aquaticum TaxID=2731212 RepID=A0ABX2ILU7_9RHOO|nr:zf-TFIIB domain-containing protein [Uliginosibacterium aquaticum]NSL55977.1 zf-TFIIB domain-containing protein [Uliginosibacterium aquaticum]
MQCPVCTDKTLIMSERQGIEIDYCPGCRGVWLDRGELDKIIERNAAEQAPAVASRPVVPASAPPPQHAPRPQHDEHYRHKRKKSFFEELFD